MASFDEILKELSNHKNITTQDDAKDPIVVTAQRQFEVPDNYDLVLGYAGDVNSQIVTFSFPIKHEGHELYFCSNQKLLWKNLTSGAEGKSKLNKQDIAPVEGDTSWKATWEVPPEAMTQAGTVEISISLYDIKENRIIFSWNTPTYSRLNIGESFSYVGVDWEEGGEDEKFPAKDEILSVNTETRQIIAPRGYNATIANFGDVGISKVFFAIDKNFRGIDVSAENTNIYINVAFPIGKAESFKIKNSETTQAEYIHGKIKPFFGNQNNNKILIIWNVPSVVTNNNSNYAGNFEISLIFEVKDGEKVVKKWQTASFNSLTISPSLLMDETNFNERDSEIIGRMIEDYFDNHYFITEA